MEVKIKNIDRLLSKFKQVGKLDLKPVITECTVLVEAQAKLLCPVNSGDLMGSIHPEVKESENKVYGRVYTQKWYAPYVEFGTGLFAENGAGRKDVPWNYQDDKGEWHSTRGQKPQPFMRPALNENRTEIIRIIKEGLDK